jgi:hypothetical protein
MSATGRGSDRQPDDHYRTPFWPVELIAPHLPRTGDILDPGCGGGAILQHLRAQGFDEAKMYGGSWEESGSGSWKLVWTEAALKDFYLNNILIHELGHLLDERNSRSVDRERYAEWFALQYGYKPTRQFFGPRQPVVQRHHKPRQPR